ncbi:inositol monophosphatase family protein [Glycomyces buryatensis]|uniref:Inositol-1-monophosphatase n=1 Tax=Glycomyces buryatensis TaxID=2570927 RepID=A0A4S8Q366_9ACTN|nr:inositol monophosphatase family protein [Glycomyces buryatensis]THV36982.1 inositol monophosphatase [Glycomyces buryatensis]
MPELLEFQRQAEAAVEVAVQAIRAGTGGELEISGKGDRDFATELDFAAEDAIRKFLAAETPGIPVQGEERGRSGDSGSEYEWVVDPIDGTINFAHGSPQHCVSLGLTRHGIPVVGVVRAPQVEETFSAAVGHGATLNGRALAKRTGPDSLHDSVVAMGDFPVWIGAEQRIGERLEQLGRLVPEVQRIRMLGAAALDMCWAAAGRVDAVVHTMINPWDVVAGTVIARESGLSVVDRTGADYRAESDSIMAAQPSTIDRLLELLYPRG